MSSEQRQILEKYLQSRLRDKPALSILHLDKIADGWESDNYVLTVEHGASRVREDWVWRIYSGAGSQAKATREFNSLRKLFAVGYPVPQAFLLEAERSPVDRPFILMEYIRGDVMWDMLGVANADKQAQLIDQFSRLFVRLHDLDWKQFDDSLPEDDPFLFVDRWLDDARVTLNDFPEVDVRPFLDWVASRRASFACPRPSPVHQDFHPANVLITADGRAVVIDWTGFDITDSRFDLAWTLVLARAHGRPGLRDEILQAYQRHATKPIERLECFEAVACARRLFDAAVSLTHGAQRMGMNAQAAEAMRANMEAYGRVYQLFTERTGLQIEAFHNLFGKIT